MSNCSIRVMLVDDHPVVRRGLVAIIGLDPNMAVVAEAANGEEAIKLFRLSKPDVTLMDLRLPSGMSGVDAIIAIRAEFPDSRFVVLTTYDGNEDISGHCARARRLICSRVFWIRKYEIRSDSYTSVSGEFLNS